GPDVLLEPLHGCQEPEALALKGKVRVQRFDDQARLVQDSRAIRDGCRIPVRRGKKFFEWLNAASAMFSQPVPGKVGEGERIIIGGEGRSGRWHRLRSRGPENDFDYRLTAEKSESFAAKMNSIASTASRHVTSADDLCSRP